MCDDEHHVLMISLNAYVQIELSDESPALYSTNDPKNRALIIVSLAGLCVTQHQILLNYYDYTIYAQPPSLFRANRHQLFLSHILNYFCK